MTVPPSSTPSDAPQPGATGEGAARETASPGLSVAAVARQLGVAPATLRTWDRRYGLGPSGHAAGSHRKYSAHDLARLFVMRRLALEGVAPQDAAKAALAADIDDSALNESIASSQGDAARWRETSSDAPSARRTTASIVHLPTSSRAAAATPSTVVDAVLAGNVAECEQFLRLDLHSDPSAWWQHLVRPAVERLAARTVLAKPGEAPELLLVQSALTALSGYVTALEREAARQGRAMAHPSRNRKMVLVFVAPGDPLPLSAHAFAAALLKHGVAVRIVTGPANEHRVLEIVTMVRPRATVMVTDLAHPELQLIHALHDANPDLPIFVGLRADAAAQDLPLAASVCRIRSFEGLVHEVLAAVADDDQ